MSCPGLLDDFVVQIALVVVSALALLGILALTARWQEQ